MKPGQPPVGWYHCRQPDLPVQPGLAGPHGTDAPSETSRGGLRRRTRPTVRGSHVVGPSGGPQRLRAGSFFPSPLERRRIDQALFAVVMEADLHGVSTRKVDDLVRALGAG